MYIFEVIIHSWDKNIIFFFVIFVAFVVKKSPGRDTIYK
jgi:hypothetical protein